MYYDVMTYSHDLRKRVLAYVATGISKSDAAKTFGVCRKTIWNWIRREEEGCLSAKKRSSLPRKIDDTKLLQYIHDNPDAYLREIAEEFEVTIPAIFYACNRLRITLKKKHPLS